MKPEMTIKEAAYAKKQLEYLIAKAILDFHEDTGLIVKGFGFNFIESLGGQLIEAIIQVDVRL